MEETREGKMEDKIRSNGEIAKKNGIREERGGKDGGQREEYW